MVLEAHFHLLSDCAFNFASEIIVPSPHSNVRISHNICTWAGNNEVACEI